MKLHVLKAQVSNATRSIMQRMNSADVNGQAKAFRGLTSLGMFSEDNVETVVLKALIHNALRHRVSYFVNHDDTEAALEKVFEAENAPFEVEGIWCLERRGQSASLSVGDVIIVEKDSEWNGVKTTRPQIWICAPVGWKQLGDDVVEAFFEAQLCPQIICEDRRVDFRRMPSGCGKRLLPVYLEAEFVYNYERELREAA